MMYYRFDPVLFASHVKAWLGERSLRPISQTIGISASTLSRITNGEEPSIQTFATLCGHMRVDPRTYFYDTESQWDLDRKNDDT